MKDIDSQRGTNHIVDSEIKAIRELMQKAIKYMLSCCGFNTEDLENNPENALQLKKEMQKRLVTTEMVKAKFVIGATSPLFYLNICEDKKIIMSAAIIRTAKDEKVTISIDYTNDMAQS